MGFSVSGSAAIVFIGVIVATGIALPPLIGSFGALTSAQGDQIDRGVDTLNTEFEIESAIYDDEDDELELTLENSGSTTLSVEDTTVLVDGVVRTDFETEVDGDADAELWLPGTELVVTIDEVTTDEETDEPERVKIVTENGIAETEDEFEEP